MHNEKVTLIFTQMEIANAPSSSIISKTVYNSRVFLEITSPLRSVFIRNFDTHFQ